MPSPIAHSLVGLTIACAPREMRGRLACLAVALVAANAADLDFLAGFVSGSVNGYHGGPTHSIGAALLFATAAALVLRKQSGRMGVVFGVALSAYVSHILLDMACEPFPTRPRLPIFWPLTNEGFLFAWRPLLGIAHGGAGGGPADFFSELLSMANVKAVALEIALFAPPLWLAYRRWGMPEWSSRLMSSERKTADG